MIASPSYYRNYLDHNQCPDGGEVECLGISISWQRGPLVEGTHALPANGAFVEAVIQAAKQRLEFYQTTKFKCEENLQAIEHLDKAIEALQNRIKRRADAGTLGTHTPD